MRAKPSSLEFGAVVELYCDGRLDLFFEALQKVERVMDSSASRKRATRRNKSSSVRAFWMGGTAWTVSLGLVLFGLLARAFAQPAIFMLLCFFAFLLFAQGAVYLTLGFFAVKPAANSRKNAARFCKACGCFREEITQTDVVASRWESCLIADETGGTVPGWSRHIHYTENWQCPDCQSIRSKAQSRTERKAGNHPDLRETGTAGGGATFGR